MSFGAGYLNLRCFIDGLEVPIIGVRTQFVESQHAQAEVSLIYTSDLEEIKPRAAVLIYVYDNYDYSGASTGSASESSGSNDLRRYKLLFAGEYVSINVQRDGAQRVGQIICKSPTGYWDMIRQHYVNYTGGAFEQLENAFLGINPTQAKFSQIPGQGVLSQLYGWLVGTKDADGQSSMIAGVQRVIREMFFASNFYFARAFNRWRLGDLVVGLPGDVTASKLFKIQFFQKWIRNQTQGGGGMVTLSQLIGTLLGMVFCTHTTIPCPLLDKEGTMRGFTPGAGDANLSKGIIKRSAYPNAALHLTIIKPDTWFLAPPACNVIFPNQYTSLSYQRDYANEVTRLFVRTQATRAGSYSRWSVERFYAPDFASFASQTKNQGSFLRRMASVLLPHEEFVGLNPQFTWVSDITSFIAKTPRRKYLAFLADHTFWKTRFSTRSVNVSGQLNLNLVPGFSGIIIANDSPASRRRHLVGHVAAVSHTIDQTGGRTHATFIGARYHDEDADFEGQGRSIEEVTLRGQEGFFDSRYLNDKIGSEVYKPLLGCDAVVDALTVSGGASDGVEADANEERTIAKACETLAELYDLAHASDADLTVFANSYTWRPKANMIELMGIPHITATASEDDQMGLSQLKLDVLRGEDLAEGFWATLVDPDSRDANENDAYTTTKETTIRQRQVEERTVNDTFYNEDIGGVDVTTRSVGQEVTYVTKSVLSDTQSNYGLADHLRKRQDCVAIYLASLRYRGMQG